MKMYNETKTQILDNVDLEKGYLIQDKIVVRTIPPTDEVQEQFHYVTIKEYENGGKDVEKVIDVEYQPAKPETYEYEDIQVYVLYTEKELNQNKLNELDNWFENDYKKYEQMFTRREALGKTDVIEDEFRNRVGENAYHNLIELYEEAEVVASEIRELRK